ncbi:hypothetical protein [Micromonospora sp. NPDC005979]|uniref:hypothetical protein n=1 Tax=unclassified Micromonospora TaxID=2617518 RepID=UPI0033A639A6
MTTEDDQTEDGPPITWKPADELPGQLPFDRLDYGDAEQLAEMSTDGRPASEEPQEMVDAPIRSLPPYDRAQKRRNQRRLPT